MKTHVELLFEIARCENVIRCIQDNDHSHPCYEIICSQGVKNLAEFQVPEPWNGHIDSAPLLYLSSNPSISEIEDYPRWDWPNDLIEDFFTHRFGNGMKEWVRDGKHALARDRSYLKATAYWSEMLNRSREMFDRPVKTGDDYVFTEIVHCKSQAMEGVQNAVTECSHRYLGKILEASGARVLAVVGAETGKLVRQALRLEPGIKMVGPREIAGKERLVIFLAAPGSSNPRVIHRVFSDEEAAMIREHLKT